MAEVAGNHSHQNSGAHAAQRNGAGASIAREIAVVKIGGSILTNAAAYRRAAIFVRGLLKAHPAERFVVVVSAQEGATDSLERVAKKICATAGGAAQDLLWSTGEIRSVALLALHLEKLGVAAAPLNIHEAGLLLPETEREAGRIHLHGGRLSGVLADFRVAVVPGFFATNAASQIVSLGRGGSDLTAVLLAEGLRACRCELIKDVPGYFTADPHKDVCRATYSLPEFRTSDNDGGRRLQSGAAAGDRSGGAMRIAAGDSQRAEEFDGEPDRAGVGRSGTV